MNHNQTIPAQMQVTFYGKPAKVVQAVKPINLSTAGIPDSEMDEYRLQN